MRKAAQQMGVSTGQGLETAKATKARKRVKLDEGMGTAGLNSAPESAAAKRKRKPKANLVGVPKPDLEAKPLADLEELATLPEDQLSELRSSLLEWYDSNHRTLPWRRNPRSQKPAATQIGAAPAELSQQEFAYYVWVCEVMSQQTQVPRVVEYFKRWVARWPTVAALANATQEEVNEAWAGLGYYRRARFLLEGARYIQQELGGAFPTTSRELQAIPGVGAYTGNAIASIACGEGVAVVDANVIRILARLHCLAGDPSTGASVKLYAQAATQLLDPERPGDFNQAMMELGACVCTVHQPPSCTTCPIAKHCQAYAELQAYVEAGGTASDAAAPLVTRYPSKVQKAPRREECVAVAVVTAQPAGRSDAGSPHFLLVRRAAGGLLAGLWEFPSAPVEASCTKEQAQAEVGRYLKERVAVDLESCGVAARASIGEVVHTFSHIRMTMRVEQISIEGAVDLSPCEEDPDGDKPASRWVAANDMPSLGLSSGVRKVFDLYHKTASASKKGIRRFLKK